MQQFKGGSMMKKCFQHIPTVRLVSLFVGLLILITPLSLALAGPKAPRIKVMTRNLYLGADIFKVVEAAEDTDPMAVPMAVAEVFNTMLYTNFWARAEAIADEIEYNDPEVIGLQEVSTFYIQTPGDSFFPDPYPRLPATDVVIDFYEVLNAALEARGLYYTAYITTNANVEVPMFDPAAGPPYYLSDVRMVDHDVILVKANYPSQQVVLPSPYDTNNYQNNLSLDIAGSTITFTRGFGIVDVDVKGTTFRFVNTHLEVRSSPGSVFRVFQSAQMFELLTILNVLASYDAEPVPVILVGDFNSSMEDVTGIYVDPDYGPLEYTPPYMQAVGAGYLDTWLEQYNPNKPIFDDGYTSGFEETIDDPFDTLETRIDLVFLKAGNLELNRSRCEVVGNEPADMVENLPDYPGMYLWPSDHAGVVARLMFERP
jgi:endonuclease/exonuclease/phosphatase family metal-dependent hydrolase